jgi:predicted 2-oxoglutarate/Fe(II)-dependent dioxygenase YbiX
MVKIENILTIDECISLKELALNFKESKIYSPENKTLKANIDIRKVSESKITLPNWFLVKLKKWLELHSVILLKTPNVYTVLKYTKGCYFKEHRDLAPHGTSNKIYTLIIELTNSNEYEGGEFILEGNVVEKNIGDVILFESYKLHELKEITSGERMSFVCWILDTELKGFKNTNII